MNFLAHLLLSEKNHESRIGSLLADFTNISNNSLTQHFCPKVSKAVMIHRQIDQYTDSHHHVLTAIRIFFPQFRHSSRIIIDILFDHFLSINWNRFCPQSLDSFVEEMYRCFKKLPQGMPQKFILFTSRLIQYDLLRAYITMNDLHEVFSRVDKRFKKPVGLQNAVPVCEQHYEELNKLFLSFFPELVDFTYNKITSKQSVNQ